MTWKTFFLILILGGLLTFIVLKSFSSQKKTHQLISRQAFIIACAETKTVKECRPLAEKYIKENLK